MRESKIAAILNLDEQDNYLYPLTKRRPIASLPFGCRYRLIDFPFSSLTNAEINSAALFIAGSGQSLYDHIRNGYEWGLDSSIGGGVFTHSQLTMKDVLEEKYTGEYSYYENQIKYVKRSRADYVLVMGSKMLANINVNELFNQHIDQAADVTAVYKVVSSELCTEQKKEFCFLKEDEDIKKVRDAMITSIEVEQINLSMNMAIIKSEKFIELVKKAEQEGVKDDINILIKYAIRSGFKVKGYNYKGYLKNIGSVKSYFEANMDMLDEANYQSLFQGNHAIITRAKNGAPTFFASDAEVKNSQFASDCFIEGNVEDSIVARKVKIAKYAVVKHTIILPQCQIGEGAQLEYVILDKDVIVGPGIVLKGTKEKPLVVEKNSVILEKTEA